MMTPLQVGNRLVELCRGGHWLEAVDELYAPEVVSVEAGSGGGMPRRMEGLEAVRGKSVWWSQNNTIHSAVVEGPFPHDERFIVRFKLNVTGNAGPMAGKRMTMDEAGLYTVKDGKVVHEEFFYSMSG